MNFSDAPKGYVPVEAYEELKQENAALRSAYEGQKGVIAKLEQTIAQLVARIDDLERRLNLNSGNSSKPPSSDGLKKPRAKPRTQSLRNKSGKKSGGQKGHKGSTLCQTANPDHVEDHFPVVCGQCGSPLSSSMTEGYAARQVFDLPEPQSLEATEHRSHVCLCGHCGETSSAEFPPEVQAPVQYGPRITGVAVYLQNGGCSEFRVTGLV